MKTAQDKLILGGHEFTSRFILGSGKFSLELVKACIEKADAQIITLALASGGMRGDVANILDISRKMSHFCRIRQEQELQMRQCESQDFQEK